MTIVDQIRRAERKFEPWIRRGERVIKRYADERDDLSKARRRMNLLWSNVETTRPAAYFRTPTPEVVRRQKDGDRIGRLVAELLEPALECLFDKNNIDHIMKETLQDRLLPGRGVARVAISDDGDVVMRHTHWRDFGHLPARRWEEVPAVWFSEYLTKDELVRRYGKRGESVPLDHRPADAEMTKEDDSRSKAHIRQVWHRPSRKVLWVSTGAENGGVLAEKDDPLRLEGFFPNPMPLYATLSPDSLIPVPDFAQYQDQADEIDDLTERIGELSEALKLVGLYSADQDELPRLASAKNLDLIPVTNFAAFASKGGTGGMIEWMPIEMVAATLQQCYLARDQAKQALFEISGIADIIRGSSDPNETLGAQQIKERWGGLRIKELQKDVQRFARDLTRMQAELVAEHYTGEQLLQIAQIAPQPYEIPSPPMPDPDGQPMQIPPQVITPEMQVEKAMEILRSDKLRGYYVDIQTDSTLEPDEAQEKAEATEFMTAFSQVMDRATQMIAVSPASAPMVKAMVMFTIRRFRAGRSQEEMIEQTLDQMIQAAQQPQQDPAQAAEEMKMQVEQARLQMDGQRMQMEQQGKAAEIQMRQQEMGQKAQMDAAKAQQDAAAAQQDAQLKAQQAQADYDIEMRKLAQAERQGQAELEMKERLGILELQLKYGQAQAELALKEDISERDAEIKERTAHNAGREGAS